MKLPHSFFGKLILECCFLFKRTFASHADIAELAIFMTSYETTLTLKLEGFFQAIKSREVELLASL